MCSSWIVLVALPGRDDAVVRELARRAAAAAGEDDARDVHATALLEGLQDVRRFARGGNAEKDVLSRGFTGQLAGEHLVEAVVVADGGEDGGVGGQRFGRQRRAVARQLADELGRQVLRIGRRAAVAGDVQAAAVAVAGDHGVDGAREDGQRRPCRRPARCLALIEASMLRRMRSTGEVMGGLRGSCAWAAPRPRGGSRRARRCR